MLQVLTTILSDVPLYRCLCVYPAGQLYIEYIKANCLQYIPATRKAYWQVSRCRASGVTSRTATVTMSAVVIRPSAISMARSDCSA
jgi:hypothetical protein